MSLKALISTAGFGSRLFPVGIAISKGMLPVCNRPIVHYLVTELIDAGIREIAFVARPRDDQIRRYFEEDEHTKRYFQEAGWSAKYTPLADWYDLINQVTFTWIEQPPGAYGTAIPALLARRWIGDSDWIYLSADDLVLRQDDGSDLRDLIRAREFVGCPAALQVVEVSCERLRHCGVVVPRRDPDGHEYVADAIEKPKVEDAASNLASISRFVLPPDVFEVLEALGPNPASGEYVALDAIAQYAKVKPVLIHRAAGEHYDCGRVDGWIRANLTVGRRDGLLQPTEAELNDVARHDASMRRRSELSASMRRRRR
ncbi:sugar phosphate nucleotidyltransferase [Tenggerimyces flavus]|uniref:UTP--glucose-1-phosphate uridylyltransferase n=1 Tax=Tenggerimyces flavus TaxID=1708749 RepID=A0ABV7YMI8_9ACTN|nr:sugar phosphate nucleotidyltransferase [Tenggerimyces flavus]MBM7789565.1 UTP--glucose-1-phosphate uridylyltransferase [Tenggerimyces flavus]